MVRAVVVARHRVERVVAGVEARAVHALDADPRGAVAEAEVVLRSAQHVVGLLADEELAPAGVDQVTGEELAPAAGVVLHDHAVPLVAGPQVDVGDARADHLGAHVGVHAQQVALQLAAVNLERGNRRVPVRPHAVVVVHRRRLVGLPRPVEVEAVLRRMVLDEVVVEAEFLAQVNGRDLDGGLAELPVFEHLRVGARLDQRNPDARNVEQEVACLAVARPATAHDDHVVVVHLWNLIESASGGAVMVAPRPAGRQVARLTPVPRVGMMSPLRVRGAVPTQRGRHGRRQA